VSGKKISKDGEEIRHLVTNCRELRRVSPDRRLFAR